MTTYNFGVMSRVWLIDASSDLVADAAMLMWLRTDAPIVVYEPARRTLAFTFSPNVEESLAEHFGAPLDAFLAEHRDEIETAIGTIRDVPSTVGAA